MIRNKILSLMAEHPGQFVSGEKMSESLHLTRAGIWKHIQALKEAGYEIESQTKQGYRLLATPLEIDEWAVRHKVNAQRLGREIVVLEEVSSTNDVAKEMARSGVGEGLVVIARRQSAGRGRMQRGWSSPLGGLWMTVVIRPQLSLGEAAQLTLSTSVAGVNAIKQVTGLDVGIKWPNDLVLEGRKLAGILAEVVGEWNTVHTMILGIGINGNFSPSELGDDNRVVTLQDLLGTAVDLNLLAARVIDQIELELERSEQEGFATLPGRWMEKAVGIGEEVEVQAGETIIRGEMKGINGGGQLILATSDGERSFSAGEVRLRKKGLNYF